MENQFFFSTNLRKTRKKSTSASFKDAYCQSDNLAETHSSMHIDNTRYSWGLRPSFKGNNNIFTWDIQLKNHFSSWVKIPHHFHGEFPKIIFPNQAFKIPKIGKIPNFWPLWYSLRAYSLQPTLQGFQVQTNTSVHKVPYATSSSSRIFFPKYLSYWMHLHELYL